MSNTKHTPWDKFIQQETNYGKVKSIWPQQNGMIIVNTVDNSQYSILGSTLKLRTVTTAYYYFVDAQSVHQRFFKALNKRQIKKYLADHFVRYDNVFDPSDEPVDGLTYIDVTQYPVEAAIKKATV